MQRSEWKTPYKRKMTEKRRAQNRAAQKTYRVKRQERLKVLEQRITALQRDKPVSNQNESALDFNLEPTSPDGEAQDLSTESPCSPDTSPSSSNSSTLTSLKSLLHGSDDSNVDELLEFALEEKPELSKILLAGLRALKVERDGTSIVSQGAKVAVEWSPELWPIETFDAPSILPLLSDPLAGGIFLRRQNSLEICYHNSRQIGLRFEDMTRPTCQSPWFSPFSTGPNALVSFDGVPPDLIPTPAQRRFPHHPFIDTIPFPWLRERAILLASLDPPAYNHFELKYDIINGGMVCWRSRAGEEGVPWDRRSWEVLPWFWKKWGWLIEEQGKVEQQSRWWRALRGQ